MSAAFALIKWTSLDPFVANFLAFACAFSVSFTGHFLWTFRHLNAGVLKSSARFGLIAMLGFFANNALLATLLESGVPKATAGVIAVTIVPLVSYVASRLWAFRT